MVRYSDKGRQQQQQVAASAATPAAGRTQAEIESDNDLTPDYVAVLSLMASSVYCEARCFGTNERKSNIRPNVLFHLFKMHGRTEYTYFL